MALQERLGPSVSRHLGSVFHSPPPPMPSCIWPQFLFVLGFAACFVTRSRFPGGFWGSLLCH